MKRTFLVKIGEVISGIVLSAAIFTSLISIPLNPIVEVGMKAFAPFSLIYWIYVFGSLSVEIIKWSRSPKNQREIYIYHPSYIMSAFLIVMSVAQYVVILSVSSSSIVTRFSLEVFNTEWFAWFYIAGIFVVGVSLYISQNTIVLILSGFAATIFYMVMTIVLTAIGGVSAGGILIITYLLFLVLSLSVVTINEIQIKVISERVTATSIELQKQSAMSEKASEVIEDQDKIIKFYERLMDEASLKYDQPTVADKKDAQDKKATGE